MRCLFLFSLFLVSCVNLNNDQIKQNAPVVQRATNADRVKKEKIIAEANKMTEAAIQKIKEDVQKAQQALNNKKLSQEKRQKIIEGVKYMEFKYIALLQDIAVWKLGGKSAFDELYNQFIPEAEKEEFLKIYIPILAEKAIVEHKQNKVSDMEINKILVDVIRGFEQIATKEQNSYIAQIAQDSIEYENDKLENELNTFIKNKYNTKCQDVCFRKIYGRVVQVLKNGILVSVNNSTFMRHLIIYIETKNKQYADDLPVELYVLPNNKNMQYVNILGVQKTVLSFKDIDQDILNYQKKNKAKYYFIDLG